MNLGLIFYRFHLVAYSTLTFNTTIHLDHNYNLLILFYLLTFLIVNLSYRLSLTLDDLWNLKHIYIILIKNYYY